MVPATLLLTTVGAGAAGLIVSLNNIRFKQRVSSEVSAMWAEVRPAPELASAHVASLPEPVRRYAHKVLNGRELALRTARLRHGGTFRTSLEGNWAQIRGEQYFTADPPSFIWWGRLSVAKGLWIDARDRSFAGAGNMLVRALSTLTIANRSSSEIDQSALQRLLGEMVWFPTALFDERYVRWTSVDEKCADATLRVQSVSATGRFEFAANSLPLKFTANRYRDLGHGKAELTPFIGEFEDYREVSGVLVPHRLTGYWQIAGRAIPYARFEVERIDYDVAAPF